MFPNLAKVVAIDFLQPMSTAEDFQPSSELKKTCAIDSAIEF